MRYHEIPDSEILFWSMFTVLFRFTQSFSYEAMRVVAVAVQIVWHFADGHDITQQSRWTVSYGCSAAATPDKMGRLYAHVWCVAWSSFPLARRSGMAWHGVESGLRFGCRSRIGPVGPGHQVPHWSPNSAIEVWLRENFLIPRDSRDSRDSRRQERRMRASVPCSSRLLQAQQYAAMARKSLTFHKWCEHVNMCMHMRTYICTQMTSEWFRELISLLWINMRTS